MAKTSVNHHEIVMALLRKGYTYRQMSEHFDISPSMLHKMSDDLSYAPEESTLKKLSKPFPIKKIEPHWAKRIG